MIVEYVDLLKSSILDSFWCYDKLQLLQWLRLQFVSSQWSFLTILDIVNCLVLEHRKSYDKNLYILMLLEWSWCPPACILFLSTPLSLNMWTYFLISASAWGQARSKLVGVDTSILHHALILIFIALWAVITHYIAILIPFLSYFIRFARRGRMPIAGILGWKRSKY